MGKAQHGLGKGGIDMIPHYTRKTLPKDLADIERWPRADFSNFDDETRKRAVQMESALRRYLQFEKIGPYLKQVGLKHEQILRALNRCVAPCADGRVYGWRALLPFLHVVDYERKAPIESKELLSRSGYAGALWHFWLQYPDFKNRFDRFLLTGSRDGAVAESRVTPKLAHTYFLSLCKELELSKKQWPFCTDQLGRGSIATYVKLFRDENYDLVVGQVYGDIAKAKSKTGSGKKSRIAALLPFDVIEIDEHKAHFIGSIGISTPKGVRYLPIVRVTLLIASDRDSEAVLAFVAIFRREANEADLMKLIALTLRPWVRRTFSLPGLEYADGAGFPSSEIEGLARCGWVMLLLDGALIHIAHGVIERARRQLGFAVNIGPVHRFERRPFVENAFRKLEEAGFQRVPSSTGSGPSDPKRRDPEMKAVKFKMDEGAVLDLIELVLAKSNGMAGKGDFGISPLNYLHSVISDPTLGFLIPHLPPQGASIPDLDVVVERGVVAGDRRTGQRPHISLDGEAYTSVDLSRRWELIGCRVAKHINEDNIQTIRAYLENGMPLGELKVLGRWSRSPHSRDARRMISAALRSGDLCLSQSDDPVTAWQQAIAKAALTKGAAGAGPRTTSEASQLAEELRRTGEPPPQVDPPPSTPTRSVNPTSVAVKTHRLTTVPGVRALN